MQFFGTKTLKVQPAELGQERAVDEQNKQMEPPTVDNTSEIIQVKGTIKKEKIPVELELGDYWYWLYFDEPYLLRNNAVGVPIYIDKIELTNPESDFYKLSDYIDKHILLAAKQTWGYAESSVFEPVAITVLK